jgi:hypothetical protein
MQPPPHPEHLPREDQELLLRADIKEIAQLGDPWVDDHILCVAVRVFLDGRTIDTSLWWCGYEILGAIKYSKDCARAKADAIEELKSHIQDDLDCAEADE